MRVLITGARAPVALEWARIAMQSGHEAWLTDSMRRPLTRYAAGIAGYHELPSPRADVRAYARALDTLVNTCEIDLIIPTCEEILYLAIARDHMQSTVRWLMAERDILFQLHDKFAAQQLLAGLGAIAIPATQLRESPESITTDPETILKPVYSRFGRQVIRGVQAGVLTAAQIHSGRPWVQQQMLRGQAVCTYALLDHGRVIAHQAYLPRYCLNQSASTYFEPHSDARLDTFILQFGERTAFHGQVAFDFIEDSGTLYVIECNPRATSGLHLIHSGLSLDADGSIGYAPATLAPHRAGIALPLFFGLGAMRRGEWSELMRDHRLARDVFADARYPLPFRAPLMGLAEIIGRSLRTGRWLTDASTRDIEWDGPADSQEDGP